MGDSKKFNKVAYDNKYIATNYDRVNLTMQKGKKFIINNHAKIKNESINSFINRAIDETMERDKQEKEGGE